ncbi:hypothetical protein NDU88_005988 [Pleurodeles waltl]|uniref:Transmembrane protein n=1 Tax=Pleurodeles waltl TaxID=8319 RepID=A0AAV7TD57_PLEWA|nr:hypothetical protein NDU88_005988 [Pleurodeles waltl]
MAPSFKTILWGVMTIRPTNVGLVAHNSAGRKRLDTFQQFSPKSKLFILRSNPDAARFEGSRMYRTPLLLVVALGYGLSASLIASCVCRALVRPWVSEGVRQKSPPGAPKVRRERVGEKPATGKTGACREGKVPVRAPKCGK